jgi:hypothetical protein
MSQDNVIILAQSGEICDALAAEVFEPPRNRRRPRDSNASDDRRGNLRKP